MRAASKGKGELGLPAPKTFKRPAKPMSAMTKNGMDALFDADVPGEALFAAGLLGAAAAKSSEKKRPQRDDPDELKRMAMRDVVPSSSGDGSGSDSDSDFMPAPNASACTAVGQRRMASAMRAEKLPTQPQPQPQGAAAELTAVAQWGSLPLRPASTAAVQASARLPPRPSAPASTAAVQLQAPSARLPPRPSAPASSAAVQLQAPSARLPPRPSAPASTAAVQLQAPSARLPPRPSAPASTAAVQLQPASTDAGEAQAWVTVKRPKAAAAAPKVKPTATVAAQKVKPTVAVAAPKIKPTVASRPEPPGCVPLYLSSRAVKPNADSSLLLLEVPAGVELADNSGVIGRCVIMPVLDGLPAAQRSHGHGQALDLMGNLYSLSDSLPLAGTAMVISMAADKGAAKGAVAKRPAGSAEVEHVFGSVTVASLDLAVAALMGMAPDGSSAQVFSDSDSDWEDVQLGGGEENKAEKKKAAVVKKGLPKKSAPKKKGATKKKAGGAGKRAGGGKKAK